MKRGFLRRTDVSHGTCPWSLDVPDPSLTLFVTSPRFRWAAADTRQIYDLARACCLSTNRGWHSTTQWIFFFHIFGERLQTHKREVI